MRKDYKKLVEGSSSTVDIILIDNINRSKNVLKKFKKMKNAKIFLINLIPQQKWTPKREESFAKLRNDERLQHVYVHNIPFSDPKDVKENLFDINKIEAFFSKTGEY